MGNLIFRYGTMGSAKTAHLLITAFNFEERGRDILCLKPTIDTRDGIARIKSRIEGLERPCMGIAPDEDMYDKIIRTCCETQATDHISHIIFIDEAQFLTKRQVDDLARIVDDYNALVICYGIRSTANLELFEGSKRLMELADKIEDIKSACDCGRKTIVNARIDANGQIIKHPDQDVVSLGGNDKYKAVCRKCFREKGR